MTGRVPGTRAAATHNGGSVTAARARRGRFPYVPVTHSKTSVQTVLDAFAGKPVPRFRVAFSVGSLTDPFTITKDTAGSYQPEY